jgi:hypothetical protein
MTKRRGKKRRTKAFHNDSLNWTGRLEIYKAKSMKLSKLPVPKARKESKVHKENPDLRVQKVRRGTLESKVRKELQALQARPDLQARKVHRDRQGLRA